MKKLLLAVVATALLFSFNACAPEDPAKPIDVNKTFPKATLSGIAYLNANTATSATGNVATYVPNGTVLSFSIAYADLGIQGKTVTVIDPMTGDPIQVTLPAEGNYVLTAAVGDEGKYEVTLPARADGQSVEVSIEAQIIAMPDTTATAAAGEVRKVVLYGIDPAATIDIISGLEFQKRLDFVEIENLSEDAVWENATYTAKLVYNNGMNDVIIPSGTQVKLVIEGDQFVPERLNDLVYIATVGDNGLLSVTLPAPSLSLVPDGLDFTLTSAVIGDKIKVESGNQIKSSYTYELDEAGTLYGGKTVDAGTLRYAEGDKVQEGKAAWKSATYTVKFLYDNDETSADPLTSIPGTAKVTITTTNRNTLDSDLDEIKLVYNYEDFAANGVTLDAPDPAVSNNELKFKIQVDFIANIKTGVVDGNDVKKQYKYAYSTTSSLWGGIDKKGGAKIGDVENALSVESGKSAAPLN